MAPHEVVRPPSRSAQHHLQPKHQPISRGWCISRHKGALLALSALLATSALLSFLYSPAPTFKPLPIDGGVAQPDAVVAQPKHQHQQWQGEQQQQQAGSGPSPEALQRLASELPEPAGEWLYLISDYTYRVPGFSEDLTAAALSALVRLFPPPDAAAAGAAAQQLEALEALVDALAGALEATSHRHRAASLQLHSTAPLRRLGSAALLALHEAGPLQAAAWTPAHQDLLREALLLLLALHVRQAAGRQIEFTHVSKCGGTSICKLAAAAGCRNPHTSQADNCMLPMFHDYPVWTRVLTVQHMNQSYELAPFCAVTCPGYALGVHGPDLGCHERALALRGKADEVDFYAQERQLPGGSADPAAAGVCPQLVSVISLRPPVEHATSHMLQVLDAYQDWTNRFNSLLRTWMMPADLAFWQRLAPAVLDNYYVRTLLGQTWMCLPFGAVDASHARHAVAKLLAFDLVLDLAQARPQQDALLRLGLGWNASLAGVHERRGTGRIGRIGLRAEQVLPLLARWNVHDAEVYRHGEAIAQLDARFLQAAAGLLDQGPGGGGSGGRPRLRRLGAAALAALRAALAQERPCGFVRLPADALSGGATAGVA
jgi:hypothetical protein